MTKGARPWFADVPISDGRAGRLQEGIAQPSSARANVLRDGKPQKDSVLASHSPRVEAVLRVRKRMGAQAILKLQSRNLDSPGAPRAEVDGFRRAAYRSAVVVEIHPPEST